MAHAQLTFWVAGRIGSWSVLVFGAKWIIRGRRRVRCGRPACITNTCLWHNLRLVHRFEDSRGTRTINPWCSFPSSPGARWRQPGRHNRALTNILVHRLGGIMARAYYGTRYLGTDGRWNGANSPIGPWQHGSRGRGRTGGPEGLLAGLTTGSAHCTGKPRGSGWDSGRTKLPNPRAPPTPSDADRGGGWERVRRHHRAGGSLEAAAQSGR